MSIKLKQKQIHFGDQSGQYRGGGGGALAERGSSASNGFIRLCLSHAAGPCTPSPTLSLSLCSHSMFLIPFLCCPAPFACGILFNSLAMPHLTRQRLIKRIKRLSTSCCAFVRQTISKCEQRGNHNEAKSKRGSRGKSPKKKGKGKAGAVAVAEAAANVSQALIMIIKLLSASCRVESDYNCDSGIGHKTPPSAANVARRRLLLLLLLLMKTRNENC